jgi:hypothetical protein
MSVEATDLEVYRAIVRDVLQDIYMELRNDAQFENITLAIASRIERRWMTHTERNNVWTAIQRERAYQDRKWGSTDDHPHEVGGWITLLRRELREAEDAWCTQRDDADALREILQVAAVAVACLQQHGVQVRTEA